MQALVKQALKFVCMCVFISPKACAKVNFFQQLETNSRVGLREVFKFLNLFSINKNIVVLLEVKRNKVPFSKKKTWE